MVELGVTQKDLAEELGISIQNLNAKLNGRNIMNIEEAAKITKILKLDDPVGIFFTNNIPKMQQTL